MTRSKPVTKYRCFLLIALFAALAAVGCGGRSQATKPALNSKDSKERRQAVEAAAEKFGAKKSATVTATEKPGDQP
jgi:ABC-type glycerol-3-phosphate transport system substrate-binding protein